MKKRLFNILLSSLAFLLIAGSFVALGVDDTLAQEIGTDFGIGDDSQFDQNTELAGTDIRLIIARIINVFLGILGIIAVGLILYAGYLWMTAGGDDTKIAAAKKTLINSVIGLVIILSSFAITQFVINRLSEATGTGQGIPQECEDVEFGTSEWEICYGTFGTTGPTPCELGFTGVCSADRFYVRSITPTTNETQMSNVTIKILFSRSMERFRPIDSIVEIRRDGVDVTSEFVIREFTGDRKGVWLDYDNGGVTNAPPGDYEVEIVEDLVSDDDPARELEEPTIEGLRYPRQTEFTIGDAFDGVDDLTAPEMSPVQVIQDTQQLLARTERSAPLITINDWIELTTQASDNTGVSVAQMLMGEVAHQDDTAPQVWARFYDGPPTLRGSDAPVGSEFRYSLPVFFPASISVPALYRAQVESWDIDGNSDQQIGHIIVVGEQCQPITGASPGSVEDPQCLSTDACSYDWQCVSRRCDQLRGVCVLSPMITQVDPWDGGEGSWITIMGVFFGEEVGEVAFGVDIDGDEDIERWVPATLPDACEGDDIWNDEWIVVEIPPDSEIPQGSFSAIRVTRADASTFENPADAIDTTVNDRGPTPASEGFNGWFEKNNITRPGLCSVKGSIDAGPYVGSVSAPVLTPVQARGVGFGETPGTVWFSTDVPSQSTAWTGELVDTQVPQSLASGVTGVQIQDSAGKRSNSVPFTVLPAEEDILPLIEAIVPPTTTPDAFITIQGQRFGTFVGEVWGAADQATAIACARGEAGDPSDCINMDASGFEQCTDIWSNTEVIAYVPEGVPEGRYNVVLVTQQGLETNGEDIVQVLNGPPRPSICHLRPRRGPAPLGDGHPGLDIQGINFTTNPSVFFWRRGAEFDQITTWLSLSSADPELTPISDTALLTQIPEVDGVSMDSGPIVIFAPGGGGISNPVSYEVFDCREFPDSSPGGDYRCCTDGPEAGLWKQDAFACAGEPRDAGYVWRFTSGQIPNIPFVIEACNQDDWFDTDVVIEQPSPVPWEQWRSGENVCLNANVELLFSMDMNDSLDPTDQGSLFYPGNVTLQTCVESFDEVLICTDDPTFDQSQMEYVSSRLLTVRTGSDEDLNPNTWYRVVLSNQITGRDQIEVGGQLQTVFPPIKNQRGCGDGTAYCFDFKTGENGSKCILERAFIHPRYHTTNELGDITTIFDDILYFLVKGAANQECVMIDVDGQGWQWGSENPANVTSQVAPGGGYTDSRGQGFALRHTAPDTTDITADATIDIEREGEAVSTDITASSTITINLGDPRVTDFWPNCTAGCINTGIGARFNRSMDPDTFAAGFTVEKCTDGEICDPALRVNPSVGNPGFTGLVVDTQLSDEKVLYANLLGSSLLEADTWYVVSLDERIRSIGGFDGDAILHGEPLEFFEWKFRTKVGDTACIADDVIVSPLSYIEYIVGNKEEYRSLPVGSPDECSPFGQILNPWAFDWLWSSEDIEVAQVTNFEAAGTYQPWCTQSCIPAGSDIQCDNCFDPDQEGQTIEFPPVCGNGIVEAGEACDIAAQGEIPGQSCTYSCLRPGNTDPATCGNGLYEPNLGEQCDPNDAQDTSVYFLNGAIVSGPDGYCSESCTLSGSGAEASGDVDAPICGSGEVTFGEQCDVTDPDSSEGCTSRCLFAGTPLAQQYCDTAGQLSTEGQQACEAAVSMCGNGVLEAGEECEVGVAGADENTCGNRCLIIGDVCGTALQQCAAGTPGCSIFCTLQGASLLHEQSSLCGDGVTGQGEYTDPTFGSCDIRGVGAAAGNPIQTVTAIGISDDIDPVTQAMDTLIRATIDGFVSSTDIVDLIGSEEETGEGEYYLQCGFTEFEEPIDDFFNDCRTATHGVGSNTCCYPRPLRSDEYPRDGAGIDVVDPPYENGVCRNTYIEVEYMGHVIDEETLNNNIFLAEWYDDPDYECPAGQEDVTRFGEDIILAANLPLPVHNAQGDSTFIERMWNGVKYFFQSLFGGEVLANDHVDYTLCKSPINVEAEVLAATVNGLESSKIAIYLQSLLKENQVYSVIIDGDITGVKNTIGVGVGNEETQERHDAWIFQTGTDICKIKDVTVDPESILFQIPLSTNNAQASANTDSEQVIVPIQGVYDWDWRWAPSINPLFDIPEVDTPSTTPIISIAARNLEGELSAYAEATVVTDLDATDNHTGRTFSGRIDLYADFCENIWPARALDDSWSPFEDDIYHFSFDYCADAGVTADRSDDLPFFDDNPQPVTSGLGILFDDTLRRYVLFNNINDDVITIQVLKNLDRLSIGQWYGERFDNLSQMQNIVIDGYPALTDGTNYYVGALNEQTQPERVLYNQVYLFSINADAQAGSRQVLEQILDSVTFNTNIPERAYCLPVGTSLVDGDIAPTDFECQTDFDCREPDGSAIAQASGICGNGRTKLQRDLERIDSIQSAQGFIETYRNENLSYPQLGGGTYFPAYTNSQWPSWQRTLGSDLGETLATDPINTWSICPEGTDQQTCWDPTVGNYYCPSEQSIFEYRFDTDAGEYMLYSQFEYMTVSGPAIKEAPSGGLFVDKFLDPTHFTDGRWCLPDTTVSPFGEQCGDGIVQPNRGEVCEVGQTILVSCSLGGDPGQQNFGCAADCSGFTTPLTECIALSICGNGIVESPEICDDGDTLNGTYGQCGADCLSIHGAFCGNGQLDFDDLNLNGQIDPGEALEFCDARQQGDGELCQYVTDEGLSIRPEVLILLDRSKTMRECPEFSGPGRCSRGFEDSKWEDSIRALEQIEAAHGDSVDFYVVEVPGRNPDQCELYHPSLREYLYDINPRPAESWSDSRVLGEMDDFFGTPTADALAAIAADPDSFFLTKSDIRQIFLITDGQIMATTGSSICTGGADDVEPQIISLREQGISTYILGFGAIPDDWSDLLDDLSQTAGVVDRDNPDKDYFVIDDTDSLVETFDEAVSCKPYSLDQRGSCALDCQSFGSYCGDRVVDTIFGEECDDGNLDDTDGCTNICTLPVVVGASISEPIPGTCGDFIVNDDEICDAGDPVDGGFNGIVPDAGLIPYGERVAYCSSDCSQQLFVDSAAFCGNGVRDWADINRNGVRDDDEWLEACDATSYVTLDEFGTPYPACDKWTGDICSQGCQVFEETTCFQCGTFASDALPSDQTLANVVVELPHALTGRGNDESHSTPFSRYKGDSDIKLAISDIRGGRTSAYEFTELGATVYGWLQSWWDLDIFAPPGALVGMEEEASGSIATNPQCSEDYAITFNDTQLGLVPGEVSPLRDIFTFDVNGETTEVNVPLFYSTAVPTEGIRVVFYYPPDAGALPGEPLPDESIDVRPGIYSSEFAEFLTYGSGLADTGVAGTEVTFDSSRDAWVLSTVDSFTNASGIKGSVGNSSDIITGPSRLHWPIDIYTSESLTTDPIALYFRIGGDDFASDSTLSISDMINRGVEAWVYLPRVGQNGQYSTYAPDLVIPLQGATVGSGVTRTVPIAAGKSVYWHVFNLVHNGVSFDIQQPVRASANGVLVPDSCSIRDGVPGDQCP